MNAFICLKAHTRTGVWLSGEHLPSLDETLGSIPEKKKKGNRRFGLGIQHSLTPKTLQRFGSCKDCSFSPKDRMKGTLHNKYSGDSAQVNRGQLSIAFSCTCGNTNQCVWYNYS
jgi:hypothetical protein